MSANHVPQAGVLRSGIDAAPHDHADTDIFGFWLFLMSDAVIFALLFATYGVMLPALAGGPSPSSEYRITPAFIETLLLLTSSFTFSMASVAMRHGAGHARILGWMAVTLLLGMAFLGFELNDFATMLNEGAGPQRSGYLSSFFALVSLHGLHVFAGCLWLGVMMLQMRVFGLDSRVTINISRLGLFWHFLDIIWIAIFSVVFLQGLVQ